MLTATNTLEIYDKLKRSFTDEQAHELSQIFSLIGNKIIPWLSGFFLVQTVILIGMIAVLIKLLW